MARAIDAEAFRNEINEYIYPIIRNNLIGGADIFYRVLHLLEEAPTIKPKQEWIRAKDRLPTAEDGNNGEGYVIAMSENSKSADMWLWDTVADRNSLFTHWMPVPEPPKEGE